MLTPELCNATVLGMNTDMLTTSEACDVLGFVSRSTLSRYVALGRIAPAMKMPGSTGAFLFARAEVERVKAERQAAA